MNDALLQWLGNRGFTGSLDDRIKQYLRSVVVGSTVADSTNDLWRRYAVQEGYGSATGGLEAIQIEWCKNQGSTASTWNDAMRNLPA